MEMANRSRLTTQNPADTTSPAPAPPPTTQIANPDTRTTGTTTVKSQTARSSNTTAGSPVLTPPDRTSGIGSMSAAPRQPSSPFQTTWPAKRPKTNTIPDERTVTTTPTSGSTVPSNAGKPSTQPDRTTRVPTAVALPPIDPSPPTNGPATAATTKKPRRWLKASMFTAVGSLTVGGVLLGLGIWRMRAANDKVKAAQALKVSEGPGPTKKVRKCANGACMEVNEEDRSMLPSTKMLVESVGMKLGGIFLTAAGVAFIVVGLFIAAVLLVQLNRGKPTNTP